MLVANSGGFNSVRDELATADVYGIAQSETNTFLSDALGMNRAGESYHHSFGPGMALGVPMFVTVACRSADDCDVHYVVKPAQ